MITIEVYRSKRGSEVLLCTSQVKPLTALDQLCLEELPIFSWITEVTRTSLEVRNELLGYQDRTVFSGSEEDMLVLLFAAFTALKVRRDRDERDDFEVDENSLDQLPGKVRVVSDYVTKAAPFVQGDGDPVAKLALIAALDIKETETELLGELCQLHEKTLMAILYLTGIGQSIAEARQAAGSISLPKDRFLQACKLAYEKNLSISEALKIQQ